MPLLLAASPDRGEDAGSLLRAGTEAYHAGNHARAADLFERAFRASTEPRLVAYNLATAKYHLARTGDVRALADAETAYRCCLEPGDPRRARALFGLGNCLLLRGSVGTLDALALRSAIDRYSDCLDDPGCGASLAADARHNQQRARLLLLQAPPRQAETPSDPDGGGDDQKDEPPEKDRGPGSQNKGEPDGGKGRPTQPVRGTAEAGTTEAKDGQPTPGKGRLQPIQDVAHAAPVSAEDAARHLEEANRRIHEELVRHRRSRARAAQTETRDW